MAEVARPRVLVTGATGFVGSALCPHLVRAGYRVRRAVRVGAGAHADDAIVGAIDSTTQWKRALDGVDTIVHLAARTHVLHDPARDPLAAYREVNVAGTQRLAEQALESGARRFIFLSSIKVNGEETRDQPFRESDAPQPQDAYGTTKLEAEKLLTRMVATTALETVILRPPLVYGPRVKGNLLRLMRLVARGVPLPLAAVSNRRSLIGVTNLVDAIAACVRAREAAGRVYLVSDDEAHSTPELIRAIARALDVRARLFRCPVALLEAAGALAGKSAEVARLTRSLEIDSSAIRRELGWRAPQSSSQGLAEMGRWYNSII